MFFPFVSINIDDIESITTIEDSGLEEVPKNNDGRENCFWCKGQLIKINTGFSYMNYCKNCEK